MRKKTNKRKENNEMYYIIKRNPDGETFNIVSNPSTGDPMEFGEYVEAADFSDRYGFSCPGVEIVDIDADQFNKAFN